MPGLINPVQTQTFTSLCQDIEDLPLSQAPTIPPPTPPPLPPPQHNSSHPTAATPCPSSNATRSQDDGNSCVSHTVRTLSQHRTGLLALLILLGIILLGFFLLLLFKVQATCRKRRPKNQRYKSVSRYFPFSYEKKGTEVVIPEVGMPKNGAAERQVLLNDSEEDEL